MKRIVAMVGIAGLSLGWALMPAGAGQNAPFQSTPGSGPPGTVIHNGDDEPFCNGEGSRFRVELIDQNEHTVATAETDIPNGNGHPATDLTVPAGTLPGLYILHATCVGIDSSFNYIDKDFTVTAAPATTTTTEATTTTTVAAAVATTTTTTVPVVVMPQATPAAPVVASPALAG
ncbi:MAG TPA: hypothetical protein VGP92_00685 [Acidimicrobiia bacterium]|jgi:hypothetical protein|nr:hypothetical protein [Acidimicrobiia bacterium]